MHMKKNAVQCGVDVARGRKSHAGRYTCCTLKSGAFVTRKSVHHTWNLRVSAGSPTRRTVDMTQQVAATNIVECFVIVHDGHVGVLQQRMHTQHLVCQIQSLCTIHV